MLKWIKRLFESRNLGVSDVYMLSSEQPYVSTWTVGKAVKEGLKVSGWVYRAVFLIAKSAASVGWNVRDKDDEIIENHHISQLLKKPNPYISRQDMLELITVWLELTGNSYLYKVKAGNRTKELWAVSPDRLHPIPSKNLDGWIAGYALDQSRKVSYQAEEIIHHIIFPDPSMPFFGISPLEIAGKTVDIDTQQQNFNYQSSARGVIDGVFTFDRTFHNQDETDAISQKLHEKYGNKRGFAILGNNAKYQRIAMTQSEMDFTASRKNNRDEILSIFGVPPQLVGAQESSTYNNFQVSELIFWTCTVIPLLDDLMDTFNHSFSDELKENEKIRYDASAIPAIRSAMLDRAKTAGELHAMGVPFNQINRLFSLGVNEYDGWDKSYVKAGGTTEESKVIRATDKLLEMRSAESEAQARDAYADSVIYPMFSKLFKQQSDKLADVLSDIDIDDITDLIESDTLSWEKALDSIYNETALYFSKKTEIRDAAIPNAIADYLTSETVVLTELSHLSATTAAAVVAQVETALLQGWALAELQQALTDLGVFSAGRAQGLARTIAGTAASLGQNLSAQAAGAKWKKWRNAMDLKVRVAHQPVTGVGNQERQFDKRYSNNAMFPLDPVLKPAQRVRCRCSQNFFTKKP